MGGNMGLKEGEKKWTNDLEFVELIAKKTMEQLTMNKNENENHEHSNPATKFSPQLKAMS